VHKVVREGYSIEFFLEGGRSRTGKLLPPKLGLLGMVVDAAQELPSRTVYFVPISIGYERVVEAKSYVRELSGGEKEGESVTGLVRAARVLAERYGRLNLQFGEILTLDRIRHDVEASNGKHGFVPKRAIVARLGHQISFETNRATAVTGGALVALALLTYPGRGVPHAALVRACRRLLQTLDHLGARVQASLRGGGEGGISERAIDDALALFASAGWVEIHDDDSRGEDGVEPVYVVPDEKRLSVDLSKNVIIHFFVPYALVCTALLATPVATQEGRVAEALLRERVQRLSRLFKFEFMFRADATFDRNFDATLGDLVDLGVLVVGSEGVGIARGTEARARVELYASTIASFLEGYRVAARTIASLVKTNKGATSKELAKRALSTGKRMFLAGEVVRREGICRPVVENALLAFLDQGYLAKSDGKLVLAESFATIDAVSAIERRIASHLPGSLPGSSARVEDDR
jgi:glycerol-3-phosphate O-acyltransferase